MLPAPPLFEVEDILPTVVSPTIDRPKSASCACPSAVMRMFPYERHQSYVETQIDDPIPHVHRHEQPCGHADTLDQMRPPRANEQQLDLEKVI
jgi:hypothetical protein